MTKGKIILAVTVTTLPIITVLLVCALLSFSTWSWIVPSYVVLRSSIAFGVFLAISFWVTTDKNGNVIE